MYKIYYFFKDMRPILGIKNLIIWFPIIWNDRDWDWAFLNRIMAFKLRRMSKLFKENGHHVNSEKDAKRMLICAILLERMEKDDYLDDGPFDIKDMYRAEKRIKYDQEYCF